MSTYLYTTKSKVLSLWPNAVTPDLQIVYYSRSTIIIEAALSLSKVVGTTASLHNVLYNGGDGPRGLPPFNLFQFIVAIIALFALLSDWLVMPAHNGVKISIKISYIYSCNFTRFFFLFYNLIMYQEPRYRTVRETDGPANGFDMYCHQ